jgi:hypothetical protein
MRQSFHCIIVAGFHHQIRHVEINTWERLSPTRGQKKFLFMGLLTMDLDERKCPLLLAVLCVYGAAY